jgi:AmmeMemoRadiSam system protein A
VIPSDDHADLLAIARDAIAAWLGHAPMPRPRRAVFEQPAAAFVTLHASGKLRGCIGHLEADRPLADVIAACAVSAASADPRFPPVSAAEFERLSIEVSVLAPFELVHAFAEVEVGRHGLLVERGRRRGLLLPQVASEWGWSVTEFVAHTCRKAGLPVDAWPAGGAELYRFEAQRVREACT